MLFECIIGGMNETSKQAKGEDKTSKIINAILLAIALFGIGQFLVVAVVTLFGVQLHWLQYAASIVLFALGILIIIFGGGDNE